ncbi:Pr6Pr family membrane protein [Leptospira sp. 'Mane']|uniref:Pr6Pr family membrane protein n=1 Tax=Leptospira sp. 'Mane' TaxID=3387407 RepID=UPI00398B39C7
MRFQFFFQFISSVIGIITLTAQFYLLLATADANGTPYLTAIGRFFSYMTIWTNILITSYFVVSLTRPKSKLNDILQRPVISSGFLVYILLVAITYHLLLAKVWNPTGLQYFVNISLHYIIPIIYLIYWIFYLKKGTAKLRHPLVWLLYPTLYAIYSFFRGEMIHEYPYPFINVTQLGYAIVFRNFLLLSLAYYILGIFIIAIDWILFKLKPEHGS